MSMHIKHILAVALVLGLAPAAMIAEESKRALQGSYKKQLGPWTLVKQTWEDGLTGCVASNYNNRRDLPVFSLNAYFEKGKVKSILRFDIKGTAKPKSRVRVIIGGNEFIFTHPGTYNHGGYFPSSAMVQSQVLSSLVGLQQSGKSSKAFHVVESSGRKSNFDARKTLEAVEYLKTNCGFGVKIGAVPKGKQKTTTTTQRTQSAPAGGTPSSGKVYGLLVKQIPIGTKAHYSSSKGGFTMTLLSKSGSTYLFKFSGAKKYTAKYDAKGRLVNRSSRYTGRNTRYYKPFDCFSVLGTCAHEISFEYDMGTDISLAGKHASTLTKNGNWFTLTGKRANKAVGEVTKYRLGQYNFIAELKSGGYWEKPIRID